MHDYEIIQLRINKGDNTKNYHNTEESENEREVKNYNRRAEFNSLRQRNGGYTNPWLDRKREDIPGTFDEYCVDDNAGPGPCWVVGPLVVALAKVAVAMVLLIGVLPAIRTPSPLEPLLCL